MGLRKITYHNQETVITAENLNEIQDAVIALEDGLFSVDNDKSGEVITITDAYKRGFRSFSIFGRTTQDGTPTPDAPVELVNIGNSGSITVNVTGKNDEQSITIATPNGLPGIPVDEGGNYTDANGQQWICDEIDFARGVYVRRVDVREITENSRFVVASYGTAGYYRVVISDVDTAIGNTVSSVCSHLARKVQWDKNEEYHYVAGDGTSKAYLFSNRWASVSEFATWLKEQADNGTPLTIIYKRGTPVETPLSAEEIAAYSALHTYKDRTTVSNSAGAWMELEYVMDSKKYLDSLSTGGIIPATVE